MENPDLIRAYEFGRASQEWWFERYLPGKKLAAFIILGLIFVVVALSVKVSKCSEPFQPEDLNPFRVAKDATAVGSEFIRKNPEIVARHQELTERAKQAEGRSDY